jgi:HK97 family phage major capsid protein
VVRARWIVRIPVNRKLTDFFAKYENESQKLARDVARYEREMKEVKTALATGGSPGKKGIAFSRNSIDRNTPEYQNFFTYLTKGKQADGLDYKTLRTDSESQGGYLIPQVMDASIRKNITEVSPVRAHAHRAFQDNRCSSQALASHRCL